MSPVNQHHNT